MSQNQTTGQPRSTGGRSRGGSGTNQFSLPPPKPHDALAVLYFGASHVLRDIYMLPDGEYCVADGSVYGQQPIDEYHGIWECWGCGGVGVVKVYLHHGYELASCEMCGGKGESGLMPDLRPRHIHDWQPSEGEGCPPRFEPQRCTCGALWLKKTERKPATGMVAGLKPLAGLLKGGVR